MQVIDKEKFFSGFTYDTYCDFLNHQIENPENEIYEKYNEYIVQNAARMKRLKRRIPSNPFLQEKLANYQDRINILILSEPWCGDAAQSLPIINNLFENNDFFTIRFFLRDKNEALMNQFLTNGTKSIPIVAFLDEDMNPLFKWGLRPIPAQALYKSLIANKDLLYDEISYQLHAWYAKDKGVTIEDEVMELF